MPLKKIGVPRVWSSSSNVIGRYNGTISTEWPCWRSAPTSALSRKQFPQNIPPAPGVIWTMVMFVNVRKVETLNRPDSVNHSAFYGSPRWLDSRLWGEERLPIRQGLRHRRELLDRFPEAREILVHIAAEAIGDVGCQFGILVGQFPEAEVRVVKGVNQLAHVLDALPQLGRVFPETRRREIARQERLVDGVAGHHPALERQHDAGRKDRIEETIGVADEQEPFDSAIARVKREFPGDVVRPELRAAGEIFLDPEVFSNFALEDMLRRLDAIARQIFSLRHDADADHIIVERDVPEPAFFRHKRNRGGAFVDAGFALAALVVGPDRDLVQFRVADAPVVTHRGKGFATRAIQGHGRAVFG